MRGEDENAWEDGGARRPAIERQRPARMSVKHRAFPLSSTNRPFEPSFSSHTFPSRAFRPVVDSGSCMRVIG